MDAIVGVLKFHRHGAHDVVHACGVGLEGVRGGLDFCVRIEVDLMGERGELTINRFDQFLNGLGEELLREKWGTGGNVAHSLGFLGNDLSNGSVC